MAGYCYEAICTATVNSEFGKLQPTYCWPARHVLISNFLRCETSIMDIITARRVSSWRRSRIHTSPKKHLKMYKTQIASDFTKKLHGTKIEKISTKGRIHIACIICYTIAVVPSFSRVRFKTGANRSNKIALAL